MNMAATNTLATQTDFNFKSTMHNIRDHYLKQLGEKSVRGYDIARVPKSSAASLNSVSTSSNNDNQELQRVMGQTICDLQAQTTNFSASTQAGVNSASDAYINSDKSASANKAFSEKMEAQRLATLKASEDTINAAFDKAVELGEKHPQLQDGIISTTNLITKGIIEAANFISNVVVEVVGKVVDALAAAWGWIKGQFATAAKNIGNFFSSIF